jgi:hypothetical protein
MKESIIRKLARSDYFQNLYSHSKELGFQFFQNNHTLTKIQIIFLSWVSCYNSLYQDLAMGEDFISDKVIEDDIRTDAYLYWRKTKKYAKKTKKKKDTDGENPLGIPSVKFEE